MNLAAINVSVMLGDRSVLDDVSLSISAGDRFGIVGPNGAGKTTLLRVLNGDLLVQKGSVIRSDELTVGMVPQEVSLSHLAEGVGTFLRSACVELVTLEKGMRALEAEMSKATGEHLTSVVDLYGDALTRYEQRGGYSLDRRVEIVRNGLGIQDLSWHRKVGTLSGGEQAKLALAAQLIRSPDVLLLDEPTNHLDDSNLEWLDAFVGNYPGGLAFASHDRTFLNRTTTSIVLINDVTGSTSRFGGTYDDFREELRRNYERTVREADEYRQTVSDLTAATHSTARSVGHSTSRIRDNDKATRFFKHARVEKAVSRKVKNAEERLERVLRNPVPRPAPPLEACLRFAPASALDGAVLIVRGLTAGYGDRVVVRNISFDLYPGEKVAIRGENGSGKSTLLARLVRASVGEPEPAINWLPGLRVAYLPQHSRLPLPDRSLAANLFAGFTDPSASRLGDAQGIASGLGLFRPGELESAANQASLGQARKVMIARLVLSAPDVLILDEPTNHVSLDVVEALEVALREFSGAAIVVTHDRAFLKGFQGRILDMERGRLAPSEKQNNSGPILGEDALGRDTSI